VADWRADGVHSSVRFEVAHMAGRSISKHGSLRARNKINPDRALTACPCTDKEPMTLLNPGDRFPDIELTRPGGETLQLPDALAGGYGVVLFYRGAWCPYCNV
jgi:hypothetical protein